MNRLDWVRFGRPKSEVEEDTKEEEQEKKVIVY